MRGAGVVFFAYIGFDAVSTAAQEAKNPKKDMPLGILGSLVICTVLYILVSGLLTHLVPYQQLNVPDPVVVGIRVTGQQWATFLVEIGALGGLATVMLVMLLGQSRVFYSMSRDGLLWPWAGKIHHRFRTPYLSSIVVGIFVAILATLIPLSVLDRDDQRGHAACLCSGERGSVGDAQDASRAEPAVQNADGAAGSDSLDSVFGGADRRSLAGDANPAGGLAGDRPGDLLHLRTQAQQSAGSAVGDERQWPVISGQ